jgi:hypothetical protein
MLFAIGQKGVVLFIFHIGFTEKLLDSYFRSFQTVEIFYVITNSTAPMAINGMSKTSW